MHEASDEGQIAGENAAHYPEVYKRTRRTFLGIVFCDPQIALVGRSYEQLTNAGANFQVGEVGFEDQGRARVILKNKGLLRVYAAEGSGCLLGVEMIAPDAEHLAHLLACSIDGKENIIDILRKPYYHLTLEKGLRTALRSLYKNLGVGPEPPLRCIDCGPGS
ncbi:MAG: hypothetical protein SFT81_06665 [Candidatus Caenarcaniphilales bacterium]|nr:hypothetical protein [Candidatus Caenarcaniphilales bacterium]